MSEMSDSRKILVVDDEQAVRDLFCEIIKMLGHEALACVDGESALECYRQAHEVGKPMDLVILDLNISQGMDGVQIMKKLKEIDSKVKAVVTSGNPEDPAMKEFSDYGFCAIIHKPYRVAQVSAILQELLSRP